MRSGRNAPYSRYQVISAQQLPKVNNKESSIVDPLVRVEVLGVPADCAEKETHHVVNNGTVLASGHFRAGPVGSGRLH